LHDTDFTTFAAILTVAALGGLLANRLRQPVLVAFIAIGIGVGPVGLGWTDDTEGLELLAELGIAVLLFLVGLKLDLHLIRTTGRVALATGLGQVLFTSVIGFGLALGLGMDPTTALYVAVALTFSSTIIIVKLLSDKRELEDLHGRIAIGFLIVQDIVVVLVMIGLTAFGGDAEDAVVTQVALVILKGIGLLVGIGLAMRFVLPRLLHVVARSPELLVLFAVSWAVAIAALSDWLEFSTEVGAFLAGFSLASTAYREAVGARLVSLRDFLLLFFFIQLGAQLEFEDAGRRLIEAGVLSAFVLVGNPLIVLVIMGRMRYPSRVAFKAGLTVAQISEFSLILAALGLSLGHIDAATVSLVTVVGLITIGLSTYLILYSDAIYDRLEPLLARFERAEVRAVPPSPDDDVDVILYGLGRFGGRVVGELTGAGHRVLAVDFDPDAIATWTESGLPTVFGDTEDLALLESLPLDRVAWVISTVPSVHSNLALLHGLRHEGYEGDVALTARNDADAERLREAGCTVVLQPFVAAADVVLELVGEPRRTAPRNDTS
jgi:Kef-type K+ transport system membrane component KefB